MTWSVGYALAKYRRGLQEEAIDAGIPRPSAESCLVLHYKIASYKVVAGARCLHGKPSAYCQRLDSLGRVVRASYLCVGYGQAQRRPTRILVGLVGANRADELRSVPDGAR